MEGLFLEKEFFSKDMNRIWIYFNGNGKGLRDTYQYIRVIHQEKNGDDFGKIQFFLSKYESVSHRVFRVY